MAKNKEIKASKGSEELLQPTVKRARRLSWVWLVPIIAAFLGLWLVKRHFDDLGEIVVVTLPSAEGLSEEKTEVRCRAVKVGIVEKIILTDDLSVKLELRISPEHIHLVRSDSQFWVVKARISGGTVSGLGTLVSGAYLELDPGQTKSEKWFFEGLETAPPTPNSVPGLRMELVASNPSTVDVGSGVYFKNNLVGKIESRSFEPRSEEVRFGVFIEEPYRNLVGTNTVFWISTGLQLSVGANGVDLKLPSVESLLRGRVAFGEIGEELRGEPIDAGVVFPLFADLKDAESSAFESDGEFLLLFNQSVKGLAEGASVEFRGLPVGRVNRISYNLVKDAKDSQTPVLIQLSRQLLEKHFPPELLDEGGGGISQALELGLRASLKSSNLLTGQRYVDLDYYPDAGNGSLTVLDDYLVLPTVESGFGQLEERVTAVLDKLNGVPIESLLAELEATTVEAKAAMQTLNERLVGTGPLLAESQATMAEMKTSLESLNKLLSADATQSIPDDVRVTLAQINSTLKPLSEEGAVYGDLRRTLDELRAATRSIEQLSSAVSDKPNSLIFGKPSSSNLIPRAKK